MAVMSKRESEHIIEDVYIIIEHHHVFYTSIYMSVVHTL